MATSSFLQKIFSWLKNVGLGILLAVAGAGAILGTQRFFQTLATNPQAISNSVSTFTTIFLGIFIEAAPFLLLGTLASGVVEVFFSREDMLRLAPRNPIGGALFGSLLGFGFPVCECGVVPLTRRLIRKGVPPHVGIAFLLASPVANPIVIASTLAAFGFGKVLLLRVGLSVLIAAVVGLIFAMQKDPGRILRPTLAASFGDTPPAPVGIGASYVGPPPVKQPVWPRIRQALVISAEEFFEMGRYLVAGALIAALMQTVVPQSWLLAFTRGPIVPVIAMLVLAVVLSICSTVDAFVALAFVTSFSTGSILAFLVFGPMVDIKSTLLFLRVFERRTVIYLIALPLMMTILAAVIINLYFPL
ncbi:MAG: permease [Anaerolineales bacterium]|nr:permease [Anaerolineales bacterium]